MFNILIISDEAKNIYALFKAGGFTPDTQDLTQRANDTENSPTNKDKYDIAFLDLDLAGWHQRLLELRQQMPVISTINEMTRYALNASASSMVLFDEHNKKLV